MKKHFRARPGVWVYPSKLRSRKNWTAALPSGFDKADGDGVKSQGLLLRCAGRNGTEGTGTVHFAESPFYGRRRRPVLCPNRL